MKKIFGWLQDGLYPNCTSIARDLEVSLKTAARDVDCMRDVDCLRDEWELPIGYDDKRHGFYFSKKVERLPWVRRSRSQLRMPMVTCLRRGLTVVTDA